MIAGEKSMALVEGGLLSVSEARDFTGLGRSTLYNMMDRGDLIYTKIGRRRLIPRNALIRLASESLIGGKAN